jgi:hypothetical protein
MRWPLDATHDPDLRSWVESANESNSDFPIQNLPFCVFKFSEDEAPRIGTAIGSQMLDLCSSVRAGILEGPEHALTAYSLNPLMALPLDARTALRRRVSEILSDAAWRAKTEPLLTPRKRSYCASQPVSATTPIFTLPFFMGRTWADCSGPIVLCCRITSTCRSGITDGHRQLW